MPDTFTRRRTSAIAKIQNARIDKLLSSMGYGSRSEIARLAKAGRIMLDAVRADDATRRVPVTPDLPRRISIDGDPLDPMPGVMILLNKPKGVTCSHREGGSLVYDFLPQRWKRRDPKISAVGRLDKQTSGLLLLTDDGAVLHRITSPRHRVRKTYRAKLARALNGTEATVFASGTLMLKGEQKPLDPAVLEIVSEREALLTITEGRYHQVRRMFAACGNHVIGLHREQLGALRLPADMAPGAWRLLNEKEQQLVFQ